MLRYWNTSQLKKRKQSNDSGRGEGPISQFPKHKQVFIKHETKVKSSDGYYY